MQHTITLEGAAARGSIVRWNALSALQESLSDTSRRVLRLRADGRSHLRKPPEWLDNATALDLYLGASSNNGSIQLSNNATHLHIEAPPLLNAAPEIFAQLKLFENTLKPQDTAVSLLEESLRAAIASNTESDYIDRGVLGAVTHFKTVLEMGFDSISLNGGPTSPVTITQPALEAVEKLVVKAPESRKVIVSGTLDTLTNSRRVFILKLRNGRTIRGFYPQAASNWVANLYGRAIVVDGEAVYRPSGDISSIVASNLRAAEEGDTVWETMPTAPPRTLDDLAPRVQVAAGGNPYAKIFGAWPGNESDEEIEQVLAALG